MDIVPGAAENIRLLPVHLDGDPKDTAGRGGIRHGGSASGIPRQTHRGHQQMAVRSLERHRIRQINWLRAAVLGANDGIVSTASLPAVTAGIGAVFGTLG